MGAAPTLEEGAFSQPPRRGFRHTESRSANQAGVGGLTIFLNYDILPTNTWSLFSGGGNGFSQVQLQSPPDLALDLDTLQVEGVPTPLALVPPKGRSSKKPLAPPGQPGRPSSIDRRLPTIIALAGQYGWSYKQIADYLTQQEGRPVTGDAVRSALYRLRKSGALVDTEQKLAHLAVPMALDVVVDKLDQGDERIAVETLKGAGIFRAHSQVKQDSTSTKMELQVKFVKPEGVESEPVIEGQIVGRPQTMEG